MNPSRMKSLYLGYPKNLDVRSGQARLDSSSQNASRPDRSLPRQSRRNEVGYRPRTITSHPQSATTDPVALRLEPSRLRTIGLEHRVNPRSRSSSSARSIMRKRSSVTSARKAIGLLNKAKLVCYRSAVPSAPPTRGQVLFQSQLHQRRSNTKLFGRL